MKAFPNKIKTGSDLYGSTIYGGEDGMDLRDYFAAKAMQSIITDGKLGALLKHYDYMKKVAEMSYEYAEAMMEARK